jgi:diguanylate cyclase (GGDEF)-like protein/PAS domain S-box-containing protein
MSSLDKGLLYQSLVEGALDAVVVADEEGRIVLANSAVQALVGRSPSELLGQRVEVLIPPRLGGQHARLRAAYAEGPTPRAMGRGMLLYARHADGTDIPVDISLTPLIVGGQRLVAAAIRDLRGRSYDLDSLRVQTTALRSAANGIVITDREGTIIWVNPAACSLTGYAAGELVGKHTRLLKSGQHGPAFYAGIWRTVVKGETWSGTIVNRRKDGTLYDEEQTIAPVVNDSGVITHFIAIKQDVTEQRRLTSQLAQARRELEERLATIDELNVQLREQAVRDPLTHLYNRRYFDEAIEAEMARVRREGKPLCLAVLDIDLFKDVNDRFGHAAGDRVLVRLAHLLRHLVRASDVVCRFGGEEFVVAMPGATLQAALARAGALRAAFASEATLAEDGMEIRCTLSAGVAQYRAGAETTSALLLRADRALYSAKEAGRDRVVSEDSLGKDGG